MTIYKEEIFGPVLCVVRVPDFASAVELINATRVWERRVAALRRMAASRARSRGRSRSAWSASTCRFRCRWRGIRSAAGSARCSAIITRMARKACASIRATRASCSAGRTASRRARNSRCRWRSKLSSVVGCNEKAAPDFSGAAFLMNQQRARGTQWQVTNNQAWFRYQRQSCSPTSPMNCRYSARLIARNTLRNFAPNTSLAQSDCSSAFKALNQSVGNSVVACA